MRTLARGTTAESGDALLRRMAARRRRDNLLFGVLAVLAVFGGGHALFSLLFSSAPEQPSDTTITSNIGHANLAGSFASEFVVAYLGAGSGQQELVARYVTAGQNTLPRTGQQVSEPAVVFTRPVVSMRELEVWTVTISVKPNARSSSGSSSDAGASSAVQGSPRQFYRVSVELADGRLRALSLPAMVEPPGRGQDLSLRYSATCSVDTPLATVAAGFLNAFLANTGDISRYTSTDSGINALMPAPYASVDTTLVQADDSGCGASGSTAHILATVTPKTTSGSMASLAYPMTLIRTGGQWEVQAIDSAPALSDPIAVVSGGSPENTGSTTTTTTSAGGSGAVTIPPAKHN